MLMSEFIERTNYTPDVEEYGFIEDAYYEFEGNKDEFCKWWLKARKGGYWEREYGLRKRERQMYDELSRANEELFSVHHQYDTLMDALSVIKTALM